MNDQRQALPKFTAEQIVGISIGSAAVGFGLVAFLVITVSIDPLKPMPIGQMAVALLCAAVGLIPLGASLYSRYRSVRWWRQQQHR